MTPSTTRRTVLLSTGAAALAMGCGDGNGDGGTGSDTGGDGGGDSAATKAPAATDAPAGRELAATSDIPVGGGKIFADEQIVVTQPTQGDFRAFSAVCTHQGCTVTEVRDGTIDCACHNSRFRIADGSVEQGPATQPLSEQRITVDGNSVRLV
ncbi:Rieske (2Fe-2S) protein [Streptomyces sp. NPDC052309]|uniref:Rieske (2Fe-2S) protein n=1 Tax=Streptomyces sp. NPDC052309 TaxID=3155421 RepID=UPI00341FAD1C